MKKLLLLLAVALAVPTAASAQQAPTVGSGSASGTGSAAAPTIVPTDDKTAHATGEPPPPEAAVVPGQPKPGDVAPVAKGPEPVLPFVTTKKCLAGEENPKLPDWIRNLDESCWDTGGNFWFPTSASKAADASDFMFFAVLGLSAFFFIAITIVIIYFVIKYRHRPGHKPQPSPAHSDILEITWSVIPTIMCVFLFVGGWNAYIDMATRPAEAITIKVTAKKWVWDFEYPNGLHLPNLIIPKDHPVELQMTSMDVLHAFFVPAFRQKQDVVPRRYTYVYITATRQGIYRLYCAEYCGKDHSQMKVKAIVLDYQVWDRYLRETNAVFNVMSPVELGKDVYEGKGCKGCHSIDGSKIVGPTWKGSWGNPVPLEDGTSPTMDATFVRTSINEPAKQLHQGYPNSMPSFAGQLSEAQINGVAAYIESLK